MLALAKIKVNDKRLDRSGGKWPGVGRVSWCFLLAFPLLYYPTVGTREIGRVCLVLFFIVVSDVSLFLYRGGV